jgi:mono/diheme cytochrome c family protein
MSTRRLAALMMTLPFVLAGGAIANAQDKVIGQDEYAVSCAICHGTDGTGHGEFAKVLTVAPADLTQLSKANDGVFPLQQVYDTIDGRRVVSGHGQRDMPIWGVRYSAEAERDLGPYGGEYGPLGNELAVRARILELVYYIQSIQKP